MGMMDGMRTVGKKLKLDSHHAMERFGVIFTLLSFSLVTILVMSGFSAASNNREALDAKAIYTSSVTTSRTQQQASVKGVYVSPDRERALVMMGFERNAVMSTSADNYQAFLTGSTMDLKPEKLKNDVTGKIVVFGSSGYIGMVLDSDRPFEQQILNLTMRANSELVYAQGDARIREDLKGQASFYEHDQWRIYFNPGASEAKPLASLAGSDFDPMAVYYDLVVKPGEEEVRGAMEEQLKIMRADLARIDEFESALGRTPTFDGDFLVNPRIPTPQEALKVISGDEIVGEEATAGDDGKMSASTLALKTNYVPPHGFNFDWRSGSIKEGYLASLVPPGQRYGDWLNSKMEAGQSGSAADEERTTFNASKIQWSLTDGTLLSDAEAGSTSRVGLADVIALRDSLGNAYEEYWLHKKDYLVKLPLELLNMEVDLQSVSQTISINDSDKALYIY